MRSRSSGNPFALIEMALKVHRKNTMTLGEFAGFLVGHKNLAGILASGIKTRQVTEGTLAANHFPPDFKPGKQSMRAYTCELKKACVWLITAARLFNFSILSVRPDKKQKSPKKRSGLREKPLARKQKKTFRPGSKIYLVDAALRNQKKLTLPKFVSRLRREGKSLRQIQRQILRVTGVELNTGSICNFREGR